MFPKVAYQDMIMEVECPITILGNN